MTYDIAHLPGDGIGPEVTDATLPLVERIADDYGFRVETTRYDWESDRYLDRGEMMPDDALDRLERHDAIFLGAVATPTSPIT